MKYIKFREKYIVSDTGLIWAIKKDGLKLKKTTYNAQRI
ncbi:MAG: hypothetical protein [Bacteriophage sp.]|nr:MAG: hypothetical protein [Bacteriophage sp.]